MDATAEPSSKKRRLNEPYVRDDQYILRKHKGKAPSLIVHLHTTHFRFDGQDGSWAYDSPMKLVLEHLKKRTVPHEMIEELLQSNVQWYDGCLIVEVQNHIKKEGGDKGRYGSSAEKDSESFSMHKYNQYITPSPMVPFPQIAAIDETTNDQDIKDEEMPAPARPKDKDGPSYTTIVLHPTALSQHHETLLLANTPITEARGKKKTGDGGTPLSAQTQTSQAAIPQTPTVHTSRGPLSQSQKMCLDEGNLYTFEADLLVATEAPLYLEPVDTPQDSQAVLDMLQHPLHSDSPPSVNSRKRTTAELAKEDAQAAETERLMLIMDERIKPSGTGNAANENQNAASLNVSRFKTIEMVRQRHEEAERTKKEEEHRVAMGKKQLEDQNKAQLQQQQQQQAQIPQRNRDMLTAAQAQNQAAQQSIIAKRQQQAKAQQAAILAQAQAANQIHAHPQQNNMALNQHQNLQQGGQPPINQSSPVVQQQTPMLNSSPMMPQGGFPMAQTSSQGAGSPARPTSAAMPNPMVRQMSRQQLGSRNQTPQLGPGTPNMHQAVPNRQMSQTPRMPVGSPAPGMQQGTPTSGPMPMQTPHMVNQPQFNPHQMAMLATTQRQMSSLPQNGTAQAGSPAQNMNPEQIQNIRNLQHQSQRYTQQRQMIQQNPNMSLEEKQMRINDIVKRQQLLQQQFHQTTQIHGTPTPGAARSPGVFPQQTPQMGHAHPQQFPHQQGRIPDASQMTPQQQQFMHAQAQAKAQQIAQMRQQASLDNQQQRQQLQQMLASLRQQYGSIEAIPVQRRQQLPMPLQHLIRQILQPRQQGMRAPAAQHQNNNGEQVPGQPDPHYMSQLRQNEQLLQKMQNAQGGGSGGAPNMAMPNFNANGMGQNFGNQPGGNDLSQQFAAMQNALNRQNQQGDNGGQGMQ